MKAWSVTCVKHTGTTLSGIIFDVKKVTSSHTEGETVILSETEPDAGKPAEVFAVTGYKLLDIQTEPYVKKGLFGRFR